MDIRQIHYFVRVAELGSFSRASIVLNIAQPALSRQVRLLEVELRQTLFLRNGRGVTTTEAGKMLLEHGRGILHQIDRAREDLGRIGGHLAGRVAVGMPPSIAKQLVLPLTRACRSALPRARLSVSEGLSVPMQESLQAGRLDIAMLYNMVPTPDLESVPLKEEELFLIGLRKHCSDGADGRHRTLAELAGLPLVIPGRPHAIRMVVETALANCGLKPNVALEIEGITTILDLLRDGAGYAILPMSAVATSERACEFVAWPIAARELVTRLSIAVSARRASTHTQKAVLELLAELAGGSRPWPAPGRDGIASRANSP